jgi:sortase A
MMPLAEEPHDQRKQGLPSRSWNSIRLPLESFAGGSRLRSVLFAMGALLLLGGLTLHVEQVWLAVKARLAERLIRRAYEAHRVDGNVHRPWRWADMHPIGRLVVPRLGVERMILSSASGQSMAFGVGHVSTTSPPNRNGICVLAGHRDGAFAFLARLQPGDRVRVGTRGCVRMYRVNDIDVVSQDEGPFLETTPVPRLALVTCYPFHGYRSSTRRYIVWCEPDMVSEPRPAETRGNTARARTCAPSPARSRRHSSRG